MTNVLLLISVILSTASLIKLFRIIRKQSEIERIRRDGEAGLYDYQRLAKAIMLLAEDLKDKERNNEKYYSIR